MYIAQSPAVALLYDYIDPVAAGALDEQNVVANDEFFLHPARVGTADSSV